MKCKHNVNFNIGNVNFNYTKAYIIAVNYLYLYWLIEDEKYEVKKKLYESRQLEEMQEDERIKCEWFIKTFYCSKCGNSIPSGKCICPEYIFEDSNHKTSRSPNYDYVIDTQEDLKQKFELRFGMFDRSGL